MKFSPQRLIEARSRKGISQQELADISGVHKTSIGKMESGQSNPRTVNLHKLAKALAVQVDFFYEDIEENFSPINMLKAREKAELSIEKVADLLGSKASAILDYENGKVKPTRDTVAKLSVALNSSYDFLIDDDEATIDDFSTYFSEEDLESMRKLGPKDLSDDDLIKFFVEEGLKVFKSGNVKITEQTSEERDKNSKYYIASVGAPKK